MKPELFVDENIQYYFMWPNKAIINTHCVTPYGYEGPYMSTPIPADKKRVPIVGLMLVANGWPTLNQHLVDVSPHKHDKGILNVSVL